MEQTKHFSLDTERYVLGSMIMSVDALVTAADLLYGEMFYEQRHHVIFNAIVDSYQDTGKIDINLLSDCLGGSEATMRVGGGAYLVSLIDNVVTTSNIKTHSKILKKLYSLRRIELFGHQVAETAKDGSDPGELIRTISGQLLELSEDQREKKDPSVSSIISEIKQRDRDIRAGKRFHIESSDALFGEAMLGYYPGHMISIASYTSVGKSSLLAQIIVDAAQDGGSIVLFSLEDGRHEKMFKILGNIANVPQRDQIRGLIDGTDRRRLDDAMETVKSWPLLIYDDVRTVEGIRLKVKKAQMKGKVDVVAVDYIQKVKGPGSLHERMSGASMAFQEMAKDLNITMIILSQIDNETARNPGSGFLGMKGAGEIGADSDIVIWLSKETKDGCKERDVRLTIRKNRAFGVVGGRDLQFSPRWTRIERRDPFDNGLSQ